MNQCFKRIKFFMIEALEEARKSYNINNTPVGAVLVRNNVIISRSFNDLNNAIGHAEILCINKGCKFLQTKYLSDCELFITLEPCDMCYNAILLSRIEKVFFGSFARDTLDVEKDLNLKKKQFYGGFFEKECFVLIEKFFKNRRNDYSSKIAKLRTKYMLT